ncbi:MAG: DNA repair protein RadA [Solirubrobacteraceae bacterium]
MARAQTIHVCSECGFASAKWHGQCPGCGAWNTLVEERAPARSSAPASGGAVRAERAAAALPVPLSEVQRSRTRRLQTGIGELDTVLGGGLVPGELVLLGGSPGIGKSTLTNMMLGNLERAGVRTLYVSGEESVEQVRLRAERLVLDTAAPSGGSHPGAAGGGARGGAGGGARGAAGGGARGGAGGDARGAAALAVPAIAETDLDVVLATLQQHKPQVCVVDSVQTTRSSEIAGAPGTVGQVREVASRLMEVAKGSGIAIVLVGHVTKEGVLAGPRVLEHLVDCVLQFEGERERPYRELRALKNRFGSTNEVGLFEMRQGGLVEVLDASARFVAEATRAPGSVLLATMEGSRPLLVEVQALVVRSELEQPRRVVSGLDRNRLALVLAILARHGRIPTGGADVFVNVVGGVRADEPGVDLAIALAVASAARGVPVRDDAGRPRACFGELGLTGELRWVGHPERRLQEAQRHGCTQTIAPDGSGGDAVEVGTLRAALAAALPAGRERSTAQHARE